MKKKYNRASLSVEAAKYEIGKGMEDGFHLWSTVITNGWISTEGLVKITNENGEVVCPFIQNRRGLIFIREGDYIIYDDGVIINICHKKYFVYGSYYSRFYISNVFYDTILPI